MVLFNTSSHQLDWSTFIGGTENDDITSITLDDRGYLFVSGRTESNNVSYFNAPNYYFENNNQGNSDAYIMAFKPDLTRVWSTYYGGNRWDASLQLKTYNNDKLYFASLVNSVSPTYPLVDLGGQAWFDSIKVDTLGDAWMLGRFDISQVDLLTSVKEDKNSRGNDLTVYPNPVMDLLRVDLSGIKQNTDLLISIFSIDGKLRQTFYPQNIGTTYQINVEDFAKGSYLLKVVSGKNVQVLKFEKL